MVFCAAPMGHIHFVGGEKGGVGKSLVARLLAQYFIDHNQRFLGFDSDRSHGALMRFYSGFASPVALDQPDGLDAAFEAAAADPDQRVLVDLAAQTHSALARWIDDGGVLELTQELSLPLTYWHVMDNGRDSVDLLHALLDRYGARLPLVLVLNELRGEKFDILAASEQRERAESLGAKVISLRKLHDGAMQKIDAQSTSFWAAVHPTDKAPTPFGLLERQRVKMWLNHAYAQIAQVTV